MSSQVHSKLNRDVRSMPKWVSETNDRIGPKPPTPPVGNGNHIVPALPPKNKHNEIEPDYEIIEFSGQQYSNEPMKGQSVTRTKTPESKVKCTLCGSNNPWVTCGECGQQIFCASCDDMYHKHPKRKHHVRKAIEQNSRPPLPPKTLPGQPGPTPPVAPPRRGKRGIMTPLMQRKDQVNNSQLQPPPSPTPSLKSDNWQDRLGSLKRGMNLMNRPLPDPPKSPSTPQSEGGMSSRSETPRSAFDSIQRPPSVTLEKIKSKASATLDRMAILQQRYRQQKEEQQRNRSDSVSSQNLSFDQWTNISPSPSNFRSGSMSSGLNSSHFDLSDDSHFNFNHQRQQALAQHQQQLNRPRTMSSSVFNLSQINRRTPHEVQSSNAWGINPPMQQAQSMAHLNCMGCNQASQWGSQQQPHMAHNMHMDDFNSQQQLNRSNLSLNMPAGAGYILPNQHHGYPPPVFMNSRGSIMYPYPYGGGMPVMNPGVMGIPPAARSRATSRAGSRAVSPAMSRKSMTLRRKRNSSFAVDDGATDDEDSDEDDRRSLISNRSHLTSASRSGQRQRRMSNISQPGQYEDDGHEIMNGRRVRHTERRGSTAKSVQGDWVSSRHGTGTLKANKIYSDLDSEGSGTRALVQAKIQEKLDQSAKKNKSHKRSSGSESIDEKPKPIKVSTEVQVGTVRSKNLQQQQVQTKKALSEDESDEISAEEKVTAKNAAIEHTNQKDQTEEEEDEEDEDRKDKPESAEADENDDLGPPPTTPDYEWECEFCTFVNEPNVKICTICCKTPNKGPKRHKIAAQDKSTAEPVKQQKENPLKKNETPRSSSSPTKSKNTTKIEKKVSPTKTITNGISKLKITSSENESDQYNNTNQSSSSGSGNKLKSNQKKLAKESVEDIWAALDENIQATADKVFRKSKVSTCCGTSPPPRCTSERSEKQTTDVEREAREIGTSPPPQSISTQTYDVLPLKKVDIKNEKEILNTESPHSINTVPNFDNHAPFFNNSTNITTPSSQWTTLDHLSQNSERISDFSRDKEDRYRSISDLRYSDIDSPHMSNGLGRRQSSYAELLTLQRTQSQMLNNGPFSNLTNDMPRYEPKPARDPETELYILLKEAELYKYSPEELHAALKNCGPDIHPIQWLRDNWQKLIQTVRSLATKYGQERIENTIGTISQQEARDALRMHGGNIWQAVSECIEQRQRKYRDISSKGNFSREDIVTALTIHQGNVELALMDLGRRQLKPFLMRIWGSPGGVENESGSNIFSQTSQGPLSEASSTISNDQFIKNDIQEFLGANASECLQTPSMSGAFMRDFHSPLQTHESDNTSTYIEGIHNYPNINSNSLEQTDDTSTYNKHMLKDIETLIGNMEQNQAKQNKEVLQSIEGMLEQLINKRDIDTDLDPEAKRILMKSPINTPKAKSNPKENETLDIKAFVWQNIQEIVPSLVQQVKAELGENSEKPDETSAANANTNDTLETTQEDSDKFILEKIIQPNIKEALIREEMPVEFFYASEIANFRMEFDRGLERDHEQEYEIETLEDARHFIYKMFVAPNEIEMVNKKGSDDAIKSTGESVQNEEQADTVLEDEEKPTTSKAAFKHNHKNAKVAKQNKKTSIPKLQDKVQKDTSKPEIFTEVQGKSNKNQDNKVATTVNQNNSNAALEIVKQTVIPINQTEKPKNTSKIPVRRSVSSTALRTANVVKQINNFEELSNAIDNQVTNEELNTEEQTATSSEVKLNVEQNLENNAEDSRSSVTSEISRAEDLFQDLEELSAEESDNAIINEIQIDILDGLTSGEEELFSAGSGSAKSSPQLGEEFTDVEPLNNQQHTASSKENKNDNSLQIKNKDAPNEEKYEAVSAQSKQNLSDLVQDTQRLIKQMKDEITLDEYESTDEDDYSEDYSAEYDDEVDDDEDGEWDEEEDEEEEDDLDYENDEELASVFEEDENIVEPEELPSDEEQSLTEAEIVQGQTDIIRTETNISPLNITNQDNTSSLLSSDLNIEGSQTNEISVSEIIDVVSQNIAQPFKEEQVVLAAENNLPEPPVETILEGLNQEEHAVPETSQTVENENANEIKTDTVTLETINILESEIMQADSIEKGIAQNNQMEGNQAFEVIERVLDADQDDSIQDLPESIDLQDNSSSSSSNTQIQSSEITFSNNTETNAMVAEQELLTITEPSSSNTQNQATDLTILSNTDTNAMVEEQEILTSTEPSSSNTRTLATDVTISSNTDTNAMISEEILTSTEPPVKSQKTTNNENNAMNTPESTTNQLSSFQNHVPVSTLSTNEQQTIPMRQENNTSSSKTNTNVTITTEPLNDTQTTKRILSKIPKPKESTTKHPSKKVPLRSKSFSGPPTPIGISSVKAIQQQYLHKQSQFSNNFLQPKAAPPVMRKKSINEVINKLTGPAMNSKPNTTKDGPSTSSGIFRPRTQIRIPKKKYHETCFSDDDYETTSSEDEPEPLDILERKRSVPVFRAYPSLQEPETKDPEELAQQFVDENLAGNIAEAQIAAALVNMKFPQDVSLWAAKECSDLDQAISMLRQECELCMGSYPMNEIVSMLKCTHKCCKQCAKTYFTVQITDRSINDCNCPFCKIPELHNQNGGHEDENLEYFSNLDIFLKSILETEVHELFQRKLRDRSLLQDPNFKWCVQCSSGFFARPKQKRLICPDCGSVTCSQCRKKWAKQHEGISCDQFQSWIEANDPEIQAQGVQEHLSQNGIDCPKCKFRYSLARGGCMHFTCTQCKFEFCYGCARPFRMGAKCNMSSYCAKLGLHAHHPRNCLFYLRDKLPLQLQFLLKENGISFDVDPIDIDDKNSEPSSSAEKPLLCPIPIQKETPSGLYDTVCKSDVPDKHAGMCRTHYVEYLTAKVAKSGIDPLPIFDLTDCVQELRRRGIALPERGPWDTDEIYKNMCSEVIRKHIPLNSS